MYEKAEVEVYGTLSSDLKIEDGECDRKYGLITVSVKKKLRTKDYRELSHKLIHFPVVIWNQELLGIEGQRLKRGVKVLIMAELDIFNPNELEENSQKIGDLFHEGAVLISVRRSNGIIVLSKPSEVANAIALNISNESNSILSQGKLRSE